MDAEHHDLDLDRVATTQSADTSIDESAPKLTFECQYCDKSYSKKKALNRHLKGTDTSCARQRRCQEEALPKPRWACSRCGKDCSTSNSVERHISKSCWKACDECAADGASRCDSSTKAGACRTCEALGRPCTKHFSPIPGSKPVLFTGPYACAREKTSAVDEVDSTTDQKPGKRKISASPQTSLEETHRSKRNATTDHNSIDYGLERRVDPLGGQAYVQPQVRKAAVSNWLQEQSSKSASVALSQEGQVLGLAPYMVQAGSLQHHHPRQQIKQPLRPVQDSAHTYPPAPSYLPPQRSNDISARHLQQKALSQPFYNYQTAASGLGNQPQPSSFPPQPSYRGQTSPKPGSLYPYQQQPAHQLRLLAQQRQGIQQQYLNMPEQLRVRSSSMLHPHPLNFVASPNIGGKNRSQSHDVLSTSLLQRAHPTSLHQGDVVLTLRIDSNTKDIYGQPIFSILHIRRNEIFGPHLNAYCIHRGKEYGLHWMFVYRYKAATPVDPDQHMRITLTWDMTPADVKDDDFPGTAMRTMDTIFVMQAKPLTHAAEKDDLPKADQMQSPGPQVPVSYVDMLHGDTRLFQSSDVNREWYCAVEQDAARLRAACGGMKSTILRQQQLLAEQQDELDQQDRVLRDLTEASVQLYRPTRLSASDPLAPKLEKAIKEARERISHQVAQHRATHPPSSLQYPHHTNPTPFVEKCTSLRVPHLPNPFGQPVSFPSATGTAAASVNTTLPSLGVAFSGQAYAQEPTINPALLDTRARGGAGAGAEAGLGNMFELDGDEMEEIEEMEMREIEEKETED
ncbi:hypothetical protein SVAN01_07777 [Stagonosporopsis vannaccii]|nr:hypothetical protein SVAN01_07777 [Stagonosporopsis vannaccii]